MQAANQNREAITVFFCCLCYSISERSKYIKHEEECFIRYPNTEKWVEKMRCSRVFLTNFEVFGYVMKHSFECLI